MLLSVEVPCHLMPSHRAACRRSASSLLPAQDLKERWCYPLAAMATTSSPIGWGHDEYPSEPNKSHFTNRKVFVGEIQSFQCDQEQLNPLRNLSGENFSSANSGSMDFHWNNRILSAKIGQNLNLKLQSLTFGALAVNKQNCTHLVEEHCSRSYFSRFMSMTNHYELLRSGTYPNQSKIVRI